MTEYYYVQDDDVDDEYEQYDDYYDYYYPEDTDDESTNSNQEAEDTQDYQDVDNEYEEVESNNSNETDDDTEDEDENEDTVTDTEELQALQEVESTNSNESEDEDEEVEQDSESENSDVVSDTEGKRRNAEGGDVRSSQCSFQPIPVIPDSSTLQEFIDACEPYVEHASQASSHDARESLTSALWYYAEQYGIVSGNWLCFAPAHSAEELWANMVDANTSGRLAGYVEIRRRSGESDVCIAAHVPDYRDTQTTENVLRVMQAICAQHDAHVRAFKASALTNLNVYRNTALQIGFSALPVPDEVREILPRTANTNDNKRKRGRRRGFRRGGGGGGGGGNGYVTYENTSYHGRAHSPSLPNGARTYDETHQGWIFHAGRPAQVYSRGDWGRGNITEEVRSILYNLAARLDAGEYVSTDERREISADMWNRAERYGATVGKWAVYPRSSVADSVWLALCNANDRGELGGAIKVGEYNERTDAYMICVYCNDFSNTSDCTRILHRVHEICSQYGTPVVANFKPDFLTYVRAYRTHVRGYITDGHFQLARLGLAKFWPNPTLKNALDQLKFY